MTTPEGQRKDEVTAGLIPQVVQNLATRLTDLLAEVRVTGHELRREGYRLAPALLDRAVEHGISTLASLKHAQEQLKADAEQSRLTDVHATAMRLLNL